jgi:hypothetical protein
VSVAVRVPFDRTNIDSRINLACAFPHFIRAGADPWKPIEEYEGKEFTRETLDIERLYSWHMPAEKKERIIKELSGLGITRRIMFPDLDGVAKSLWETEVLWSE